MTKKIFVALSSFGECGEEPLNLLKRSGYFYSLNSLGRRLLQKEIIEMGKDFDGVIAGVEPYDDDVLENLPKLRCISRCGVGVDNISLPKCKEKGIAVRNTPDAVIQPVAELTLGLMLDLLKKISYHNALVKSRHWKKETGNLLAGKNVGILGLGRIGRRVAEIMLKLDAKVYGADLSPDQSWAKQKGVKIVSVGELLKVSDILSIHVSVLTDHPFQLSGKEFSMMRPGAFLVNVSRGKIVVEEALFQALSSGQLGGAALDVFSQEPYAGGLCDLPNVVLTPHIATLTHESRLQMEIEATKNLLDFFNPSSKAGRA